MCNIIIWTMVWWHLTVPSFTAVLEHIESNCLMPELPFWFSGSACLLSVGWDIGKYRPDQNLPVTIHPCRMRGEVLQRRYMNFCIRIRALFQYIYYVLSRCVYVHDKDKMVITILPFQKGSYDHKVPKHSRGSFWNKFGCVWFILLQILLIFLGSVGTIIMYLNNQWRLVLDELGYVSFIFFSNLASIYGKHKARI